MTARNIRLRRLRSRGRSTRQLSREFGITHTQVIRILEQTGGDPLASPALAKATVPELEAEQNRLRDRIAADRRRLRIVLEELQSRQTDRILGL